MCAIFEDWIVHEYTIWSLSWLDLIVSTRFLIYWDNELPHPILKFFVCISSCECLETHKNSNYWSSWWINSGFNKNVSIKPKYKLHKDNWKSRYPWCYTSSTPLITEVWRPRSKTIFTHISWNRNYNVHEKLPLNRRLFIFQKSKSLQACITQHLDRHQLPRAGTLNLSSTLRWWWWEDGKS